MTTTTVTPDTADTALLQEFALAVIELTKTRSGQCAKDTPGSRAAVAAARGRIDAVLDMYLAGRDRRSQARRRPSRWSLRWQGQDHQVSGRGAAPRS